MEGEAMVRGGAFLGILTIMACWQALAPRRSLKFGYRRWPANLGIIFLDSMLVHHSVIRGETNSNFGFNLSIWDRIFGTYQAQPGEGHDGMTIGLAQYQSKQAAGFVWMLALPFTGRSGGYPMLQRKHGP